MLTNQNPDEYSLCIVSQSISTKPENGDGDPGIEWFVASRLSLSLVYLNKAKVPSFCSMENRTTGVMCTYVDLCLTNMLLSGVDCITNVHNYVLTLPYLTCGASYSPSSEATVVGPMRNPEVPEGWHDLLEVVVNFKREDHCRLQVYHHHGWLWEQCLIAAN